MSDDGRLINRLVVPGFTRDLRARKDGSLLIEQRAGTSPPQYISLTSGEVLTILTRMSIP